MELRHLRYFVAVAEERHFGRAAERLCITQPPLSQQIQALERELGVQLFTRGRRVDLTEVGRLFLAEARRVLGDADRALRVVQAASAGIRSRLRVGYPAATVDDLPPVALRAFQERYPDTQIETVVGHTGAHLEALHDGDLDVAFICGAGPAQELVVKPLRWERTVLAVPQDDPLARSLAVRPEQLAGKPLILFPRVLEPFVHDQLTGEVLGAAGVIPCIALEATTLESTYTAVAAGLGVAFVAESTTRILAACGVAHRAFAPPTPRLQLGLAWCPDARSNPVRCFTALLDELRRAADAPVNAASA
ncbi:MAG TPA: LysR substrate-binding domain-containing protein [Actinomycetota bacterium]